MDVHGRDLRYFTAVADELNFTRAAERLYVSQPALSKQIRMLEKQLGAELFVQDQRSVRLTAVGEALLPARPWGAGRLAGRGDGGGEARAAEQDTLVVGMSTSPGRGLLPALRTRLMSGRPAARPVLHQVNWADRPRGWPTDRPMSPSSGCALPGQRALPDRGGGRRAAARGAAAGAPADGAEPPRTRRRGRLLRPRRQAVPRAAAGGEGRCGTTGSPWTHGRARHGSGWWPAPRRRTRRSPTARAWCCSPPGTLR